jgi:cytochrome oxidase Cu insertion factor (SCO1/SenC/PrrC family)
MSTPEPVAEPRRFPSWVNPFSVAFVIGAVLLTVLPFMQRKFLKAPPPISSLGEWSLTSIDDGSTVGSAQLQGRVFIVSFVPDPCDAECVEAQKKFSTGLGHTDDLKDAVHFVTIVREAAAPALKGLATGRWHVLTGSDAALTPVLFGFRHAWDLRNQTDAGTSLEEYVSLPALALVDQAGFVRDFWRTDAAGRGNSINGARLLAEFGTAP